MESYGELLKKTRESKEIDLDRASREISIEKRYLQGLEDEDNGVFPGDAYMIGFLTHCSTRMSCLPRRACQEAAL